MANPLKRGGGRGVFYPEAETKFLRYYSQFFNTAEFDAIFYERFYNDMKQGLFFVLSRATPDGFHFALKVPEKITHKKKLRVEEAVPTMAHQIFYHLFDSFICNTERKCHEKIQGMCKLWAVGRQKCVRRPFSFWSFSMKD